MRRTLAVVFLVTAVLLLAQLPKPGTGGGGGSAASNITLAALGAATSTSGALTETVKASAVAGTYRFSAGVTVLGAADATCLTEFTLSYVSSGTVSTQLPSYAVFPDLELDNFGHPLSSHVFTTSGTGDVVLTGASIDACASWNYRVDYMLERITAP